jgi:hypothetical protein
VSPRLVGLLVLVGVRSALAGAPSAAQATAAETRDAHAPIAEGALDNDVFVAIAPGVLEALVEGDRALARAHASQVSAEERARSLDAAFDPWQRALVLGESGWSWPDPTPTGERRLCEGVRAGVERRLRALAEDERARWTARFEPQAARAFAARVGRAAPARAALAGEVLRRYPLTAAAAQAALELGDLALEAGLLERARAWYARAESDATLLRLAPTLAAIEARRASTTDARANAAELWRTARGLACVDATSFGTPARGAALAEDERGLRPGGVFLADGRFALQTPEDARLFALEPSGKLASQTRLRFADYLQGYTPELHFEPPREPPGWPLLPAASGDLCVFVLGRTAPDEPNALLALTVLPERPHAALGLALGREELAARRAWAVVGELHFEGDEEGESVPALAELGDYEFQPGPVVCGERILVQVRQYEGQVKSWLLAFERGDGTLAWKQPLAAGADRVENERFARTQHRVAGQPLLVLDEPARVFVGTHLGLGVLLDGLTGEPLFGLKNRRRGEHEPGWNGDRPLLGSGPGGTPVVLWAPMDSDRVYALDPRPLARTAEGGAPAWVRPPLALGDAHELLGGDAEELLVLGERGSERVLSARRAGRDPIDALALGADERFAGLGLVSSERVWSATNRGVYLFDRTRELYLLDHAELPTTTGPAGGDLYARGAHVLVVGESMLGSLLAR